MVATAKECGMRVYHALVIDINLTIGAVYAFQTIQHTIRGKRLIVHILTRIVALTEVILRVHQ